MVYARSMNTANGRFRIWLMVGKKKNLLIIHEILHYVIVFFVCSCFVFKYIYLNCLHEYKLSVWMEEWCNWLNAFVQLSLSRFLTLSAHQPLTKRIRYDLTGCIFTLIATKTKGQLNHAQIGAWLGHNTAHSQLIAYRNFQKSIATAEHFCLALLVCVYMFLVWWERKRVRYHIYNTKATINAFHLLHIQHTHRLCYIHLYDTRIVYSRWIPCK